MSAKRTRSHLNPMLLYNVVQGLGEIATQSDLKNLREVSSEHHKLLSKTYFDLKNHQYTIHSDKDSELYFGEETNTFPENSGEFFHIYRILNIKSFDFMLNENESQSQIEVGIFLNQVNVHITKMEFHENCFNDLYRDTDRILKFINEFPKLKRINLNLSRTTIMVMEKLEMLLNEINNEVIIGVSLHRLTIAHKFLEKYGSRENIRITKYSAFDIETPREFDEFTKIFLNYKKIIEDRSFSFYFWSDKFTDENEDQAGVKYNLALLAPYIEDLNIDQRRMIRPWDLISGIQWPVLEHLCLTKYQHSLNFVKNNCPKLQRLELISCSLSSSLSESDGEAENENCSPKNYLSTSSIQ